jgi:hypothetical protein
VSFSFFKACNPRAGGNPEKTVYPPHQHGGGFCTNMTGKTAKPQNYYHWRKFTLLIPPLHLLKLPISPILFFLRFALVEFNNPEL